MAQEHSEISRAANADLRNRIEQMLDSYERDISAIDAARRRAAEPVTVWSPDNLVRVTANVAGVVEVHLEPEAFKRSTPEKLAESLTATVQRATRTAVENQEQVLAPLIETADALPDLPDLVPGAPSTRELREQLLPPPLEAQPAPPPADDDDEDDYFRNQGYLR